MNPITTRLDSFSVEDLPPTAEFLSTAAKTQGLQRTSRATPGKTLNRLLVLKALAEDTRLQIAELCSHGKAYTAKELTKIVHCPPRQLSEHFKRLHGSGLFYRRRREDRRAVELGIRPEYLRLENDGTRTIDFGSGSIRFPGEAPRPE